MGVKGCLDVAHQALGARRQTRQVGIKPAHLGMYRVMFAHGLAQLLAHLRHQCAGFLIHLKVGKTGLVAG